MKFMSYNIYEGAPDKLADIIKIVKSENPDYLTINEANTFPTDDNKILKEFAEKTGFAYFDIALCGTAQYHVAGFSKFPFLEIYKLQPLARACLITVIDTPLGKISVAGLHLTPLSEDARHEEIDLISQYQSQYENKILMGDMNALSPEDMYPDEIVKNFTPMQLRKFTKDGKLRFDVIEKMKDVGYIDIAVKLGKNNQMTVPTKSDKGLDHMQSRLDYFFVSKSLVSHLESYDVIKNDLTDQASDHYPITMTLA